MSDEHANHRTNWATDRRSVVRTIGAGVVGSTVAGTDTVIGVVRANHDEPYGTPDRTEVKDSDGDVFADVRSSVNGPKTAEDDIAHINQAVAVPIGYNEDKWDGIPKSAKNVQIEFNEDSVPLNGDWKPQAIEVRKQGDSSDSFPAVVDYAIDVAWSVATWYVGVPAPNPADLLLNDDNTNLDHGGNYIDLTYNEIGDGFEGAGMNWEVDFDIHNGDVPTGTWSWDLSVSGDVGYYNVGGFESGWNKVGDFNHSHTIEVDVVENT